MTQIEFDLGLNPTPAPTMAFAPDVQETLVRLMATAILAVHHAGTEAMTPANANPTLTPERLERKAMVYLRQSSPHQVQHTLES